MCRAALQAAQGDPDRAFSFLIDGIPQQMVPGDHQQHYGGGEEFEDGSYEEGDGEEMNEDMLELMEMVN